MSGKLCDEENGNRKKKKEKRKYLKMCEETDAMKKIEIKEKEEKNEKITK